MRKKRPGRIPSSGGPGECFGSWGSIAPSQPADSRARPPRYRARPLPRGRASPLVVSRARDVCLMNSSLWSLRSVVVIYGRHSGHPDTRHSPQRALSRILPNATRPHAALAFTSLPKLPRKTRSQNEILGPIPLLQSSALPAPIKNRKARRQPGAERTRQESSQTNLSPPWLLANEPPRISNTARPHPPASLTNTHTTDAGVHKKSCLKLKSGSDNMSDPSPHLSSINRKQVSIMITTQAESNSNGNSNSKVQSRETTKRVQKEQRAMPPAGFRKPPPILPLASRTEPNTRIRAPKTWTAGRHAPPLRLVCSELKRHKNTAQQQNTHPTVSYRKQSPPMYQANGQQMLHYTRARSTPHAPGGTAYRHVPHS